MFKTPDQLSLSGTSEKQTTFYTTSYETWGCSHCLTNCHISCRKPMEEASSETLAKAVIKPRWQERAKKSVSNERSLSTGDTGRW